jgi:hypothetical protein
LLFAAYSVAISANDSEYFAEICKDIANSLETDQGRIACEAQDEVLQICDQLYINDKITENQLLYLRHLVLIREEAVASLYDEFQEHQSVPLFAKALYDLANTHPFQTLSEAEAENDERQRAMSPDDEEEEDEEDEEEEEEEVEFPSPEVPKRKSSTHIAKGLIGVISLMNRAGIITKTETSVLYEMVEEENDYVLAAYELYEKDKNLEDLQDTLIRCAKLEIRKRVTEIQEKELEALQKDRELDQELAKQYEEDEKEISDEEEDEVSDEVEEDALNQPSGSDEDEEEEDADIALEDISLSTILQSLSVENIWEKSVPEGFIKAVFIAVIRNQLDLHQSKMLCDLFHARYDLVHAAWEVFTVQKDLVDFIDTLKRIVRDVDEEEIREEVLKEMKYPDTMPDESSQRKKPTPTAASAAPSAAQPQKTATATTSSAAASNASAKSVDQSALEDRKAEAMSAVNTAKRELLKHSLEMMVKQKLTTAEKAAGLYARYLSGDILTDAAIEAYAADRDVGEFLDTLQVLANNSKEDLEILMNSIKGDEEEEESSSSPAVPKKSPEELAKEDHALTQIEEIVAEMLKSDMIGPGIAEEFRKLVRAREPKLIEAYASYQQTKSGAELVNTLLKIVIAAVEAIPKAAAASSAPAPTTSSSASNLPKPFPMSNNYNSNVKPPAAPASTNTNTKKSPSPKKSATAASSSTASEAALDPSDQRTVCDILLRYSKSLAIDRYFVLILSFLFCRARAINNEQFNMLTKLIESNHPQVGRIFTKYEDDKDVYGLIDGLKAISISPTANNQRKEEGKKKSSADEEQYDEDFNEDEEDEDDEEEGNEGGGTDIETRFMEIIQSMQLTDLETAALRLAIAENDPAIRDAIDRFRVDLDEDNLMNAMKNAARTVIHRTLSSRMGKAFEQGGDANQDEEEDEESPREVKPSSTTNNKFSPSKQQPQQPTNQISPNNKSASPMNYDEEFDEIEDLDDDGEEEETEEDDDIGDEEDETEEGDGDDEDESTDDNNNHQPERTSPNKNSNEQSSNLLVTKTARDHIFPILVQELVKENILNKSAGRVILQEFAGNNPVITTALDIYDQDNEMGKLVESLQQLVDSIDE